MFTPLKHALQPRLTRSESARQRFTQGYRSFVMNELAADLKHSYEKQIRPAFERANGRAPRDGAEVHDFMLKSTSFPLYNAVRVSARRMVWNSVLPVVRRTRENLTSLARTSTGLGSLRTEQDFPVPRYVDAVDVHMMPGSYTAAENPEDLSAGSLYDQGLNVSNFGALGEDLDDIGQTLCMLIKRRFPEFAPRHILDLGCTVGHQSTALARAFPEARVDAVDVAEPVLRYAHARANVLGIDNVHFRQMNAATLDYPDASFDFVFSSMLLHELPLKEVSKVFAQCHRVLRPGGLMLHYELPPNNQMAPYESFYLDWDSHYNGEPFFKAFRDQDPRQLCRQAGFSDDAYFQAITPSLGFYGERAVQAAIDAGSAKIESDKAGRLSKGIQWFAFGAWKR